MPRPLIFSNGRLFVGMDDRHRIRDLFYPHVGLYNHLSGHPIRMGFWAEGRFTWTDEESWSHSMAYEAGTLAGISTLRNESLGLEVCLREFVPRNASAFIRLVEVKNLRSEVRTVRLFFSHDLRLAETDIGDTAFFNPFLEAMVHYKGPHWLAFCLRHKEGGIDQFACGTKGFGGLEGTWRDAEDGELEMNPIAQGSVDSTIRTSLTVAGNASAVVEVAILAAGSLVETEAEWAAWRDLDGIERHEEDVERQRTSTADLDDKLAGLPRDIIELAKRSLLVLEAMSDHGGAILAATDSDIMETARANYCYTWPRDGAHICAILDRLGRPEIPRRFFRFCDRIVSDEHPMLLQKYRPDGTLGASWHPWIGNGAAEIPFQEDETASVLVALAEHFRQTDDPLLLDELYEPMIQPMARVLEKFRDPATGLPKPSYDLWEERRGVHTYTAASVFAGLRAAAEIADRRQDAKAADYRKAADEIRSAVLEYMPGASGRFVRSLFVGGEDSRLTDETPDASTLWLALYGLLDPNEPLFEIHMRSTWEALWVTTPIGGLARYQNDYYFRASHDVPGNPWVISTLWLAQCLIARAQSLAELDEPLELLGWASHLSGPTGVLPEQVHPFDGRPLSVSPLTWSHAEFLRTSLDWCERRAALSS